MGFYILGAKTTGFAGHSLNHDRQDSKIKIQMMADNTEAIGAKRGGQWEQCSKKVFELAEIFRKIIQI
jgi:hypothetical protein